MKDLINQPQPKSEGIEKSAFESLKARVAELEKGSEATNARMKHAENEIEALKRMIQAMGNIGSGKGDTNIDVTQILVRINLIAEEVKSKAEKVDLDKLRLDLQKYVDRECQKVEKQTNDLRNDLRNELDRLRAEFEQHRAKDFMALVDRVAALEKQIKLLHS